jgi:indole-3-glycerol phosphate synthase
MGSGLNAYLDDIIAYKRAHRPPVPPNLEQLVAIAPPPRSLLASVGTARVFVIAECKKASPSKGLLAPHYDPVALAQLYANAGASAISVLTDERFFGGSLDDLRAVRQAVDLPLLRKDFTLDERDLLEARAAGADLVLLIARVLPDPLLGQLVTAARDLGLEPLVEVHDEEEVHRALEAMAPLIGINNRDLTTFKTDLATSERLLPLIPRGITVISESGISNTADVLRLRAAGVHGVLVGEALIIAPDPAAWLRALVEAGCPDCTGTCNIQTAGQETATVV